MKMSPECDLKPESLLLNSFVDYCRVRDLTDSSANSLCTNSPVLYEVCVKRPRRTVLVVAAF